MKRKAGKIHRIIGLDFDGVFFDHSENKLKLVREFGADITLADTASDLFPRKLKTLLAPAAIEELKARLYDDPSIALKASLISGAEEGMAFIKENGWPYYIISRRKSTVIPAELLKRYGLWPKYFGSRNVFFVDKDADKDAKAVAFGVNTFLDDKPSVLDALQSVASKFLFDPMRAYNEYNGEYKKVHSWGEFIDCLH